MDKTLAAEALLAVSGIARLLDKEPKAIGQADARRAAALPERIATDLKEFLSGAALTKPSSEAYKFPYNERATEIIEADNDVDARLQGALADASDQDLVYSYSTLARAALGYLREHIQPRTSPTFGGDIPIEPGIFETYGARRVFRAVDDPMTIMEDLRSGTIVSDQVQAMIDVYPGLYKMVTDLLVDAIADRQVKDSKWQPSWRKRNALETLLQLSRVSPELAAELQQRAKEARDKQGQASTPHRPLDIDAKADFATDATRLGQ
jgi:hypothetical protein